MADTARTNAAQWTLLLLSSRLSQCLLLPADGIAALNLRDRLLVSALSGVLMLVLTWPALSLLRHQSIVDRAYRLSRSCGRAAGALTAALCLFVLCLDVAHLAAFVGTVVQSSIAVTALVPAFVAVALVASSYGLSALTRAAAPVAVLALAVLAVLGVCLLPHMRSWYLPPVANSAFSVVLRQALAELPRSAELFTVVLIAPRTVRAPHRAYAAFAGLTAVVTAVVSTTALGVLGDFAACTAYPYYAAVAAARLGVLERPDILIAGVWLSTCFVRITLFATLWRRCVGRLGGRRAVTPSVILLGVAVCAVSLFLRGISAVAQQGLAVAYTVLLLAVCLLLPLVLAVAYRQRRDHP